MKAVDLSKTSVNFYQTLRNHTSENYRCVKLIQNLNNAIEPSPCWEINCRSFRQAIARLLRYLNVHQHRCKACHSSLQWDRINVFYSLPRRPQWPRGLRRGSAATRLLRLWVRIPPGHESLSVVSVVYCHVEVSATSWSLVQRSPVDCGVSDCDREASIMRRPWPNGVNCTMGGGRGGIMKWIINW